MAPRWTVIQINKCKPCLVVRGCSLKSVDFHISSFPFNSVSWITAHKIFLNPVEGTGVAYIKTQSHYKSWQKISSYLAILQHLRDFFFPLRALLLMGTAHVLWGKNELPQLEDLSRELTENLFFHLGKRMFPIRTLNLSWLTFLANTMCKFFSSLKIKQTLWNLIRLIRDLFLVPLFFSPPTTRDNRLSAPHTKSITFLRKKNQACCTLPKD